MRSSSFGVITFFWLQLFSGQLYMLLVGSYCLHLISLPTIFSYEHRQLFKSSSVKVVFRLPIMPTLGCPLCHRHQLFSPFDLIIHPIKNISIFRQQIYIKNNNRISKFISEVKNDPALVFHYIYISNFKFYFEGTDNI